jgi:energy-coupling factor transport system substrate-specific component
VNPIGWVQELQGPGLMAVICGLIFIEELGVPLFFAPGDIVLAISGIAIAGGRVNAAAMVGALLVAIVFGGLLGREIFAALGWQRLMRVAQPLHARGALERARELLRRGGWRAVFTARLLPGLRVHTTQVAGVSGMPRTTYLGGLLPATVVYIAAFVGLGAAIGRPILALIHEAEHQVLIAAGLLVGVVVVILLTREPVRRALASLYAAGWTGPLRLRLDSVGLLTILGALGLNFTGHAIAVGLKLPLFLDSVGTILAGIVAGPWVGGSVGFVSNLISSNTIDPVAAPYGIVSFAVGFAAGLSRFLNWHKRLNGWIALWLLCVGIAAVVSTPLNFLANDGKTSVGFGDAVYGVLAGIGMPRLAAAFLAEAAVDLPDKLITVIAALLITQGIPQPQAATAESTELDLGEALTFVVRSRRWVRRLVVAAACVLFAWLIVPYLILSGYLIELARERRAGGRELPPWNRPWAKLKDGVKINLVLGLWTLPALLLSFPGAVTSALREQPGFVIPAAITSLAGIVAAVGGMWTLLVLLLEPAIFTEFLDRGIRGGLNLARVTRRIRVNVALSVVVGALVIVLTFVGLIGLLGLLVGVLLTLPYASFVGAYLVGLYARLTTGPPEPTQRAPAAPAIPV